jgi:hypothetical protein
MRRGWFQSIKSEVRFNRMVRPVRIHSVVAVITLISLVPRIVSSAQAPTPPVRVNFEVQIAPGRSLGSDGSGSYVDGERGILAFHGAFALALCTDGRICGTSPAREPETQSERRLVLDLRSPVAASGAKDRGIIRASSANMGAFWGQDMTKRAVYNGQELPLIRRVLDLDVGHTIESERVEIRFFMNGVQHILQFGPWTAGQVQRTNQVVFHGEGTTRGTITRVSETKWLLRSASESIGRLWDNHDPSHPVDLGLYRFSYEVQFDRK